MKRKTLNRIAIGVLGTIAIFYFVGQIFITQSFTITSGSMEGSLLTGDKIWVSKTEFGARVPFTPLSIPFVSASQQNAFKPYVASVQLPYWRFGGNRSIEHGEIILFNFPPEYKNGTPIDKRENYIKRCIGLPGDLIEMRMGKVYCNDSICTNPSLTQHAYKVRFDENFTELVLDSLEIVDFDYLGERLYLMQLNERQTYLLSVLENTKEMEPIIRNKGWKDRTVFPHHPSYKWNLDNYGPLWIPRKGETIELNGENWLLYGEYIQAHEGLTDLLWDEKTQHAYLNDQPVDFYTFQMDAYFVIGDNRYNSEDSRIWGFVPENHIIGKPYYVWQSDDGVTGNLNEIDELRYEKYRSWWPYRQQIFRMDSPGPGKSDFEANDRSNTN